jgi:hypothetical protein
VLRGLGGTAGCHVQLLAGAPLVRAVELSSRRSVLVDSATHRRAAAEHVQYDRSVCLSGSEC